MYVVILGCGRMGAHLATLLSLEEHSVVIIDRDTQAFERLSAEFSGMTVLGNGIDIDAQKKAGVAKAHAFVALAANDNTNTMAAQVAKHYFGVGQVVARLYDVENQEIYRQFGIEVVSPTVTGALQVRNLIAQDGLRRYSLFEGEGIELVRSRLKNRKLRTVEKLNARLECIVTTIKRGHEVWLPKLEDEIIQGDELIIAIQSKHVHKLAPYFHVQGGP